MAFEPQPDRKDHIIDELHVRIQYWPVAKALKYEGELAEIAILAGIISSQEGDKSLGPLNQPMPMAGVHMLKSVKDRGGIVAFMGPMLVNCVQISITGNDDDWNPLCLEKKDEEDGYLISTIIKGRQAILLKIFFKVIDQNMGFFSAENLSNESGQLSAWRNALRSFNATIAAAKGDVVKAGEQMNLIAKDLGESMERKQQNTQTSSPGKDE